MIFYVIQGQDLKVIKCTGREKFVNEFLFHNQCIHRLLFGFVWSGTLFNLLDPVVQSIVSLTISLRHKFVKQTLRKLAHAIYRDFFSCKKRKFLQKNLDIFLIFAQNIDCGYTCSAKDSHIFFNKK